MASRYRAKTISLTEEQSRFLKERVAKLRSLSRPEDAPSVSESAVLRGLLDYWMRMAEDSEK